MPAELESREVLEREAEVERMQELCAELRAQRISFPERAATEALAAWTRYVAARNPAADGKAKTVSRLRIYFYVLCRVNYVYRSYLYSPLRSWNRCSRIPFSTIAVRFGLTSSYSFSNFAASRTVRRRRAASM